MEDKYHTMIMYKLRGNNFHFEKIIREESDDSRELKFQYITSSS